ncbi:hypothetical protein [Agromyces sp. Marseille-Q5079]|uniref:hypothetical protein n=1 Tax=Agromyces sp. Marseille-Q5079 TaxID=3439059 RepID=UPI003D9C8631
MNSPRPAASAAVPVDDVARARRDRRLLLAVVIWVPLAIIAAGALVLVAWLPRLPDEIITHWGVDGPDGVMPPLGFLGFYVGISLLVVGAIAAAVYGGGARGRRPGEGGRADAAGTTSAGSVRPTAVAAPAVTTALTLIMLSLTGLQLDGRSPTDAAVWLIVIAGLGIGATVGLLAWILLPEPPPATTPAATPALALGRGEKVVWTSTARAPWPVWALIGLVVLLCTVPVVIAPETGWIIALVLVIAVAVLATTAAVRVTVDGDGLSVRAALGFRLAHVRVDEVVSAAAVDVSAAEFGGWGFRFDAAGRRGVIIRSGPAIEVARRDAKPFVVTVADAATGAALLNGLVARDAGAAASD